MTPAPSRLLAGIAGKPHGLRGELFVEPISDDPRRFVPGAALFSEDGTSLVIESSRAHGQKLLVKFVGSDSRDAAELLRGPLYVDSSETRELDEGEYWDHDLIGCEVVPVSGGDPVGRVRDVMHAPAQDLLVVDTPVGERLIPVVKPIVAGVDMEGRRVFIEPTPGLLD